jgi:DNA-binding cell septation regulator SpoVG
MAVTTLEISRVRMSKQVRAISSITFSRAILF